MSAQDIITETKGVNATSELLNEIINDSEALEKVTFRVTHRNKTNIVNVVPLQKTDISYQITVKPNLSAK